ncbi:MAG: ABC transporter ATP-binding protein [Pseudomonadota bacterium]
MALLSVQGVTKRYGRVLANDAVDIDFTAGRIHAVLGENGAGKSTLVKMVYGAVQPDAGRMLWAGEPLALASPAEARARGIGMVFQHFSLFETMTVAENVALAVPDGPKAVKTRMAALAQKLDLPVDPDAPVHALSVGERQRVEILRCLLTDPKLIILDEPTAALAPSALPSFFALLRTLRDEGRAIVFISHKIEEIRALCDEATVMRGGKVVARIDPREHEPGAIAALMIGHEVPRTARPPRLARDETRLTVTKLTAPAETRFQTALDDVSFTLKAGEIVGIAGVSGNGQAELARLLSGERLSPRADMIRLGEAPVGREDAGRRRARGFGFVPEERLGRGSVPGLSLGLNGFLTGARDGLTRLGFIRPAATRAFADGVIAATDVRCSGQGATARSLSGGNLQKFIIGREMRLAPRVLLVSQPTWGVDVGAAAAVRQRLVDMAGDGTAILVVSDELDEILDIADGLHIMFRGRLSPRVPADTLRARIGLAIAGDFAALDVADEPERAVA